MRIICARDTVCAPPPTAFDELKQQALQGIGDTTLRFMDR